jgi:hypothetical protein
LKHQLTNFTEEEKAVAKKEKDERKAAEKAEKEDKRKSVELDGGKPERKSLLSRFASKRKSRNVSKDEADAGTTGTATGAAAGTTAVLVDDVTENRKGTETPEATRSSAEDVEVIGSPISPVRTKDTASLKTKPNLERHITNIETSSESESDTDEDRARKREKKQKSALLGGVNTVKSDDDEFASADEAEAPVVVSPIGNSSIGDADVAPATASTKATKSIDDTALPNDNSSTVATKSIAERAVSSPVIAIAEAPVSVPNDAPLESTAFSRPDEEKEKTQESRRSRGFFSMFKSSKAAERQPGSFSGSSGKAAIAKDTTTTVPAATTATGSSDLRAISPSSFNRHGSTDSDVPATRRKSLDHSDVSSLSSSGLDEDDLQDGRTGRMTRALGSKKTKTTGAEGLPTTGAGQGIRSDDDDSDQFEEARDHFDEGLAPRPNFAGQAKSSSPARETRFKEEV